MKREVDKFGQEIKISFSGLKGKEKKIKRQNSSDNFFPKLERRENWYLKSTKNIMIYNYLSKIIS